jgi:IS5 family transposase
MTPLIPFQLSFRQELPEVVGNMDYHIFRDLLERIEEILKLGHLDVEIVKHLIQESEDHKIKESEKTGTPVKALSKKKIQHIRRIANEALRCSVARSLMGEAYRVFSAHLADSVLLQKFCMLDNWGGPIKVPSKSTLQRYEQLVPEAVIRQIITRLNTQSSQFPRPAGSQRLELATPVNMDDYYADLTVIKTNIHFPVDWVLLTDAIRTLLKSIIWIRKSGIKNRMQPPEELLKTLNRYAMQMTHTRRRKESKKERKRILRILKKMTVTIKNHACKHRDLLANNWKTTDLKEGHVKHVISRINRILKQLPQAIHQAHERIIGERAVKSQDKLLSLYEPDTNVIVRGKAGAEVEFGNTLFLGEQRDGLILDWRLYKDKAPSDNVTLIESLDRMKKTFDGYQPKQATGDRGLFSKKNGNILEKRGIENNLCPRDVTQLQKKLQNEDFAGHQLRRGQTEGRIGIMKNCFLGTPFRNKGFVSREQGLSWKVLSHNLWVLARLPRAGSEETQLPLAA